MGWLLGFGVASLIALAGAADAPAQSGAVAASDDQRRIHDAIAGLKTQRAGVVDAYVVVAALDADPVFNREAREASRVLASRFDAAGRTVVLAHDEGIDRADVPATPDNLATILGGVASVMSRDEDVLVLYTTSHGSPHAGLNFRDPDRGAAVIAPDQLAGMLDRAGFKNRLVILQACFSGQFVDRLATPRTVIATAASAMKSSFGCSAGNDWTFFGYALINQAMRQPDTFVRQVRRAFVTIIGWEEHLSVEPSNPQIRIGADTAGWLSALDAREPKTATAPVGQLPSEITP